MNKFSLENRASPEPTGAAGDIPYAVDGTTVGWVPHATGTQYLQQTDAAPPVWVNGGGGGGSVTSVAQTAPADLLSVSGSPVTGAGTLALAKVAVAKNKFYGGPAAGADADPTFRLLDADDLDPWVEKFIVERPAGIVDGYNRSFTLSQTPMHERIGVAVDGMVLIGGLDYGWLGTTFRLALDANAPTREIRVWYSYKAKVGSALTSIETLPPVSGTAAAWDARTGIRKDWKSVVFDDVNGAVVAVGTDTGGDVGRVMQSIDDGVTWGSITVPAVSGMGGVCFARELGRLIAVGSSTTATADNAMYSDDGGATWTATTKSNSIRHNSVCWSPSLGRAVAVGSSGSAGNRAMWTSDGSTWNTASSIPGTGRTWRGVCWAAASGLFVAVADDAALDNIMVSADGDIWTAVNGPTSGHGWDAVCSADEIGLLVAVSAAGTGRAMTSTDGGLTWSLQTPPVKQWYGVTWSAKKHLFVAVGDIVLPGTDCAMSSSDGATWLQASTTPSDSRFVSVISLESVGSLGRFVAVANDFTTNPLVMTSDA